MVVGGYGKVLALILFSVDRSKELYQFQKPGVNDLLNALGRVFNDRYRADSQPSFFLKFG